MAGSWDSLKSILLRGADIVKQTQLNISKRELAAQQLITHAGEMQKTFPQLKGLDFNTNADQPSPCQRRRWGSFVTQIS